LPNQFQEITPSQIKKIKSLHSKGKSLRFIAGELGIHNTTVLRYTTPAKELSDAEIESGIRRHLKRSPLHISDLAELLSIKPTRISRAIVAMQRRGAMILRTVDGRYDLGLSESLTPGRFEIKGGRGEWTHRFGFVTDNHLCNKHARLDVLNAAYDEFRRQGITTVFNAGNMIDGEMRFNKGELVTAPGMDNQIDYWIDNYPERKGVETLYIAGDDHEGWYQQREGVEIGRYMQSRAREQGRNDLKYLGYAECDIALKFGEGESVLRVVHPGGGSAYAISYTDQKRAESYQGGEKPHIELVGHYHKFNHGYPREIHVVQGGCTCDQTLFMRKKRIQAHVGFSKIKIKQDASGAISRLSVEWFPFYDRGFYGRRY
jgi:hypothetical protein